MNAHREIMWGGDALPAGQTWAGMRQQGWQTLRQRVQAASDLYQTLTPEQQSKAHGMLMFARGWVR
jgi:hypothetical protein